MKSFLRQFTLMLVVIAAAGCQWITAEPAAGPISPVMPTATVTFIPTAPPSLTTTPSSTATLTETPKPTATPTPTVTSTPTVTPRPSHAEITLTLLVPASFLQNVALLEQVDQFSYSDADGRTFRLKLIPANDRLNELRARAAAGELPDLFALFNKQDVQTFNPNLINFADQEAELQEFFLPGGVKSVSIDDIPYGVPWRRVLCTSSYWNLAVSSQTEYEEAAIQAVLYLTNEANQRENYDKGYWFPTRVNVNDETAQCSPESSDLYTVAPDPAIQAGIEESENFRAVIAALEEVLKAKPSDLTNAPTMRDDTTFNLDGLTYIVNDENGEHVRDGRNNSALLVPITEPAALAELPADKAMIEALPDGLVIGALIYGTLKVADGEFISFEADPERTYGLYIQSDDPLDLSVLRVFEVSLNSEFSEITEDVMIGNINGNSEDRERFIGVRPFVLFAIGSPGEWSFYAWWICIGGGTT